MEVVVLEEAGGEVGRVGVLHERVGEVDNVRKGEERQCDEVRVAVLINFAISNRNEGEADRQEVEAEHSRAQELLEVVLGAQLGGGRGSGRASRGLDGLGLTLQRSTASR